MDNAVPMVEHERYCLRCGYLLRGLSVEGSCPECGTSVALSLREPWLVNCSPEHLGALKRGLSLMLGGMAAYVVLMVIGVVLGVGGVGGMAIELGLGAIVLAVSVVITAGYWLYTTPDPREVTFEPVDSARKVVRITAIAQLGVHGVSMVLDVLLSTMGVGRGPQLMVELLMLVVVLVSLVLWVVGLVAALRYTRWIGARVPDALVVARSRRYVWLLPVISVVGAVVVMLGPLIAMVMYWNLLDRVRRQVSSLLRTGARAELAGVDAR